VCDQSTEVDGRLRRGQVTSCGQAGQFEAALFSKSPRLNSRCRRRSQPAVVGGHSPAMRADAGHTPLKIRRSCYGRKYNERLIN